MKRILSFLSLVSIIFPVIAENSAKDYRVVMKPAHEFNTITVTGNIVVECRFHDEYSGYVVYHTNDNSVPRVTVESIESNLFIAGDSVANSVTSRVVVLCHEGFKSVTCDGGAIVVAKRIPQSEIFDVVVNDSAGFYAHQVDADRINVAVRSTRGVGIKEIRTDGIDVASFGTGGFRAKKVSCGSAQIQNSGSGNIKIKDLDCGSIIICNGAAGSINVKELSAGTVAISNSGGGNVSIKDGDAQVGAYDASGSGDIDAWGVSCANVTISLRGTGAIAADAGVSATVNKHGDGDIVLRSMPDEVNGNIDNIIDIIKIRK